MDHLDGVFTKNRFANIYNVLGIISGGFLILLFGCFISTGAYSTLDEIILSWFFVCFGLLVSILCGASLYVNRKAYIHVDEQTISAFCHFGLSLKCSLSDVKSVSCCGSQLTIQLKNGKSYVHFTLKNACQIERFIHKMIFIKPGVIPDQDALIATIHPLKKQSKYEGIASIICFLLLFPNILLTSGLTGWKDLSAFNSRDWVVFAIMAGIGILVIVVFCILLRKHLLHTDELNKMQEALCQSVLQTASLRPGNAIKLFLDEVDEHTPIRLTVYGFPNSDNVYFTVEQVEPDYTVECVYESKIYANIGELAPEIEGMTEVPLPGKL